MKKRRLQIEKAYLRKNQEIRFEILKQNETAQLKLEQQRKKRLDETKKLKELEFIKEGKRIKKKEKQAKKLELLESEILKRLKETHLKQQLAIEEIEKIFKFQGNGSLQNSTTDAFIKQFLTASTIDPKSIDETLTQSLAAKIEQS